MSAHQLPSDYLSEKWFCKDATRSLAEDALQFASTGAFVVRPAANNGSELVLSHRLATGRVAHTRIVYEADLGG